MGHGQCQWCPARLGSLPVGKEGAAPQFCLWDPLPDPPELWHLSSPGVSPHICCRQTHSVHCSSHLLCLSPLRQGKVLRDD